MNAIISVNKLAIQIGSRFLMKDVSFDIKEGDAILLSGENGNGKTTLLKAIMQIDRAGKHFTGNIFFRNYGDLLTLGDEELQKLKTHIAYVSQKDDYSRMGTVLVKDLFSESSESASGRSLTSGEINDLIDKWIPRKSDNRRVFDAKSKPAKFSGGEQRLLTVFSALVTRPHAELLIIDEPLNNLDFENAKLISNLINRVVRENPKMGLIMISHCRIFPFITREIRLSDMSIQELANHYVCHSCFGTPNSDGYYT